MQVFKVESKPLPGEAVKWDGLAKTAQDISAWMRSKSTTPADNTGRFAVTMVTRPGEGDGRPTLYVDHMNGAAIHEGSWIVWEREDEFNILTNEQMNYFYNNLGGERFITPSRPSKGSQ